MGTVDEILDHHMMAAIRSRAITGLFTWLSQTKPHVVHVSFGFDSDLIVLLLCHPSIVPPIIPLLPSIIPLFPPPWPPRTCGSLMELDSFSDRNCVHRIFQNHFYEGREDVVMRLITYIEKYEPHLLVQAQQTLQDYLGREDQLLLEISRWEESWANEALGFPNSAAGVAENNTSALGFPNSAGGAAAGVTENNTSALGFPNSAGGAATGAADSARTEGLTHHPRRSSRNVASAFPNSAGGETENNTSTSGVPNSTGGAADSARTDRRSGLTHTPRRSSRRNVASMHSGPDAYTNIVKDAKTSATKRTKRNQDNMSD